MKNIDWFALCHKGNNCSENFNEVLASYGVAPRRGWPAINFFFNTGVDANNQIYMDEPWSRPGDYVLMRALTDLVCGTSACRVFRG